LPTVSDTARTLRDRPLGRIAILALVVVAAVLVSRSCGSTETEVSQDEAIAIAKDAVAFEPNNVIIRFLKQGLQSKPFWAVSLSVKHPDGRLDPVVVVVVDATTGEVTEIRRQVT
jgi:hypothetical protein